VPLNGNRRKHPLPASRVDSAVGYIGSLTLGVAFVINDMALVIWGGNTFTVPVPETLQGATRCSGIYYPKNRLFVLVTGGPVFIGLWPSSSRRGARRWIDVEAIPSSPYSMRSHK
jgi:hypothetical protein